MSFYENLIHILDEKDIKIGKMYKDLNINKGNVYSWKNGTDPSAKYVIMLAEYLNVSADTLLGISRPRSPEDEPEPEDSPNVLEAVTLFRQLPEREQIKFIGRLEDAVNN